MRIFCGSISWINLRFVETHTKSSLLISLKKTKKICIPESALKHANPTHTCTLTMLGWDTCFAQTLPSKTLSKPLLVLCHHSKHNPLPSQLKPWQYKSLRIETTDPFLADKTPNSSHHSFFRKLLFGYVCFGMIASAWWKSLDIWLNSN